METTDFNRSQDQIKRPVHLVVSCPECFKKFKVDGRQFPNTKPSFQCNSCESQFWVSAPDCFKHKEVIGFKAEFHPSQRQSTKAIEQAVEHKRTCPKCGYLNGHTDVECKKCRIVFSKYSSKDLNEPKAPQHIKETWLSAARNYNDMEMHMLFVKKCRQHGCLDFAMYKYKKILNVNKNEEIATKLKKQIIALSAIGSVKEKREIPKMDFSMKCFFGAILFMSSILVLMGFFIPETKNLMGFGAAVLSVTVASLFYRRSVYLN